MEKLKAGAHVHLMGICGTAMASLAGLLNDRGYKVTGSDQNPYPPMSTQLESLGIQIQKGYRAENLNPRPDFVIVGNVISANNPEAIELMLLGVAYASLPQAMGEMIIADRQCICISGTHGKTTTTSLMAWVAQSVGVEPGFLIGGIPKNFSQSFQNPRGNFFVIEGDEYDTAFFDKVPKFIHYRPRHVIFTSCEFDHADIYKDLDAVKSAFARLMKLIPADGGTLMACAEDKNVMELAMQASGGCVKTYGIFGKKSAASGVLAQQPVDYQAKVIQITTAGTEFEVFFFNTETKNSESLGKFHTVMSGDYNILNAVAVIGLCHRLAQTETGKAFDLNKVREAVASFQGVKRRQEVLGEPRGVLVIEDFAHHPTAVRETLKGLQQKYSGRKIFAVFEPRSATSRRKVFQNDYLQAFQGAQEILIAQAFDQAKINEADRFSSEELVADLKKDGKSAHVFSDVAGIVAYLSAQTHRGDLIVIMSNGGFDGIYGKLMSALEVTAGGHVER